MNVLPLLTAWQFAAAGAACALGPIIIHLLNRRRYRTVEWAAMDFLREAIQRNRRILQIRDLILLALRTLAILLFGLALARPFFSSSQSAFDHRQPLHAILLIDNSLSMGYESLAGNLLDKAKERASEFIGQLPLGSKISVIPVCGSLEPISSDPYDTPESAREALRKISVVDRSAPASLSVNLAREATAKAPALAKRLVLFGDQQQTNWQDVQAAALLQGLPSLQVVDVAPAEWENTWIADIRVQDDLADTDTPTTIIVELAHRGTEPRRDVPVTLSLGETIIGERTVTLEPGPGVRQVEFQHVFNTLAEMPEPNRPLFLPLKASLPPDRLPADDARYVAVPIVAALPVVFIDQHGDQEDVAKGKIGETRHVRQLLAPKSARAETVRPLISVRHLRAEEVTQETLADARLVVVAGLRDPGTLASLLRDYVRQGGQLLLAAGADFDPIAWQGAAWEEGRGVLPLPLAAAPIGEVPEIAGEKLKPFALSFESLAGEELFQLANVAENDLRDLYAEPFFFKAVAAEIDADRLRSVREATLARVTEERTFLHEAQQRQEEFRRREAAGELSEKERQQWRDDDRRRGELRPNWLAWAQTAEFLALHDDRLPAQETDRAALLSRETDRQQPRVLARFTDERGPAYIIERRLDRGRVAFVTTGMQSSWNTLPKTNAMVMFDRLLRGMIAESLPQRNLATLDRVIVPVPTDDREIAVTLTRPQSPREATAKGPTVDTGAEPLDVGFVTQDHRGVTVSHLLTRGVYRVRGYRSGELAAEENAKPLWEVPLVVNGEAAESELDPLPRPRFEELAQGQPLRWVAQGEEISLAGEARYSQDSWWWLIAAVLVVLLVEMSILAWPALRYGGGTSGSAVATAAPVSRAA